MESGSRDQVLLSSVAIYFCASFPALMAALSVSGLCLVSVMIPSYSLLSEICLIRFRSSLASINTLQVGEEEKMLQGSGVDIYFCLRSRPVDCNVVRSLVSGHIELEDGKMV